MGSHDPFKHLKKKLWSKEGQGIKLAISGIVPISLRAGGMRQTIGKLSTKATTLL
jgi:hypothetical protein